MDSSSESEYDSNPKSDTDKLGKADHQAYYDILSKCQEEGWYDTLANEDKLHYKNRIKSILKPDIDVPTFQNVLDLPVDKITSKKMMLGMFDLEEYDRINPEYNTSMHAISKQLKYYSNEENKAELDKIESAEKMILDNPRYTQSLHDRILLNPMTQSVREILYDKYMNHCVGDCDRAKYQEQIETILSIPIKSKKINIDLSLPLNEAIGGLLKKLLEKFDSKVYGMDTIKEELLCMVVNMVVNPESKFKAIGMCGPPGVGKTLLARMIAEVMDLPLQQISLGGVTDSSFLEGHSFTYLGSEPGCIVKAIIQMGWTNGIIYLDEIDKISKAEKGKEIEHALLHITDFTQNHDFRDKYMPEIPINLSNYIFIYSMNTTDNMDTALTSRIPMIDFGGYNHKEKHEIVQKFLLPEMTSNYGLNQDDIVIESSVCDYLISKVHEENESNYKSGVRGLKNTLDKLIKRINLYKFASINGALPMKLSFIIPNFKLPYSITTKLIDQVLKSKPKQLSYYS